MADELKGKRIAFLAADMFEQVELKEPWKALEEAGAEHERRSRCRTARSRASTTSTRRRHGHGRPDRRGGIADDYDGLVLPGGVGNPDQLRVDENAVSSSSEFFEQGKPVGAICHGHGR